MKRKQKIYLDTSAISHLDQQDVPEKNGGNDVFISSVMEVTMICNNLPKPQLSPNFTIDDIHKIREWNYERMKEANRSEIIVYYKNISEIAEAERKSLREQTR